MCRFSGPAGVDERTDMVVGRAAFLNPRVAAKGLPVIRFVCPQGRIAARCLHSERGFA
jgi:hypothetical protein